MIHTTADLINHLRSMGQFNLAENVAKAALMDRGHPQGTVQQHIEDLLDEVIRTEGLG